MLGFPELRTDVINCFFIAKDTFFGAFFNITNLKN